MHTCGVWHCGAAHHLLDSSPGCADRLIALLMVPLTPYMPAGHSMGAGTAALLTMMLRETIPECAEARCYALACPACMTLELATACKDYVTSVVHGTDVVPTFSAGGWCGRLALCILKCSQPADLGSLPLPPPCPCHVAIRRRSCCKCITTSWIHGLHSHTVGPRPFPLPLPSPCPCPVVTLRCSLRSVTYYLQLQSAALATPFPHPFPHPVSVL